MNTDLTDKGPIKPDTKGFKPDRRVAEQLLEIRENQI